MHDTYVVIYRPVFYLLSDAAPVEQYVLSPHRYHRLGAFTRIAVSTVCDICMDSVFDHIILKVLQLVVYSCISEPFCFIDIVQLAENDIKSFAQAVEVYYLPAIFPGALSSEIRVDEQKRLHGQIFEFKIPCRMVGCDMRSLFQPAAPETVICIVIMKIRNTPLFVFTASVLSDIVRSRRSGYQREVDRDRPYIVAGLRTSLHSEPR